MKNSFKIAKIFYLLALFGGTFIFSCTKKDTTPTPTPVSTITSISSDSLAKLVVGSWQLVGIRDNSSGQTYTGSDLGSWQNDRLVFNTGKTFMLSDVGSKKDWLISTWSIKGSDITCVETSTGILTKFSGVVYDSQTITFTYTPGKTAAEDPFASAFGAVGRGETQFTFARK